MMASVGDLKQIFQRFLRSNVIIMRMDKKRMHPSWIINGTFMSKFIENSMRMGFQAAVQFVLTDMGDM
jgi:hypothetical protein